MSTLAPNRPRSRWPKRLVWSAFILLLVLGGPLLYFNHQRSAASRELQDAIDEVERVDAEWRLEQLEARRRTVPDGKNSAFVIIKAHKSLPANWNKDSLEQAINETPPPCRLSPLLENQTRQEIAGLTAALDEARKLVEFPEGRFRINYSRDFISTLLPDHQKARDIAAMMELHVLLCLHDGDLAGAWTSLRALLNTGRGFGDEPMLISHLIRMEAHRIGVE